MTTADDVVFTGHVHVTDDVGAHHAFRPGDSVPGWARPRVGPHVVGPRPVADAAVTADANVTVGAPVTLRPVAQETAAVAPPPTSGPGSAWDAWQAYAQSIGVAVGASWSRQEIIDTCERHQGAS